MQDQVRAAYDRAPEREWQRLAGGAQARLEYLITMHVLTTHLPPATVPCRLLDAGGGPGRYTLALAARGYHMTLFDLSPALLALAQQHLTAAEPFIQQHVDAIDEGSITDLSRYPDASFDGVLCLGGPLSHVIDPSERRQALAELRRVARPQAPIIISVMNRLGGYRSAVQWPGCFTQFFPHVPRTGITTIGPEAAPTYWFLPDEFVDELTAAGLQVARLYGCNGLGAHLDEQHLLDVMADQERWAMWGEVVLQTADHPMIVGVSNHILAVTHG
jgi:SAM-dependent methyltransferase